VRLRAHYQHNGAGYTIPAAAEELGIALRTLRKAIQNGEVKTISFGGSVRITRGEIQRLKAFFEQGEAP